METASDQSPAPASVHSQYSAASSETLIDEHVNAAANQRAPKRPKGPLKGSQASAPKRPPGHQLPAGAIKLESDSDSRPARNEEAKLPGDPFNQDDNNPSDQALAAAHDRRQLGTQGDPYVRQFCIRMKSTLTKRGCQHFKSSGYRVVHVVAHLRAYQSNDHGHLMDPFDEQTNPPTAGARGQPAPKGATSGGKKRAAGGAKQQTKGAHGHEGSLKAEKGSSETDGLELDTLEGEGEQRDGVAKSSRLTTGQGAGSGGSGFSFTNGKQESEVGQPGTKIIGMVAVAIALPPPSINELRLESDTFVWRLGLDLRISHIEPKITELLHYPVELLAGRSLYSLVHPADVHQVQKCHQDLLRKGQMMSGYYRLLARSGGYIWIQTCATLICNSNSATAAAGSTAAPTPSSLGGASSGSNAAPLAHGGLSGSPTGSCYSPSNLGPPNCNPQQTQQQRHHQHPNVDSARASLTPSTSGEPFYQQEQSAGHFKQMHTPFGSGSLTSPAAHQPIHYSHLDPSAGQPLHLQLQPQHQQQFQPQQDQEQCVIFVNYMITNVIDKGEIVDICQGADFRPVISHQAATSLMQPQQIAHLAAGSTAGSLPSQHNRTGSPASSCPPSPASCLSSAAQTNNAAGQLHQSRYKGYLASGHGNGGGIINLSAQSSQSPAGSLASNRPAHLSHNQQQQQQNHITRNDNAHHHATQTNQTKTPKTRKQPAKHASSRSVTLSRQSANSLEQAYSSLANNSNDENGLSTRTGDNSIESSTTIGQQQQHQFLNQEHHQYNQHNLFTSNNNNINNNGNHNDNNLQNTNGQQHQASVSLSLVNKLSQHHQEKRHSNHQIQSSSAWPHPYASAAAAAAVAAASSVGAPNHANPAQLHQGHTTLPEHNQHAHTQAHVHANHHHHHQIPYSRSDIYKAAFVAGLAADAGGAYAHQHHNHHQPVVPAQQIYHQTDYNTVSHHQQTQGATVDANAAVAAVAAVAYHHNHYDAASTTTAQHQQQLQQASAEVGLNQAQQQQYGHHAYHHHHGQHHHQHHHLSAAAAAAAAAASAATTSPYYNYYGYYGNKFL